MSLKGTCAPVYSQVLVSLYKSVFAMHRGDMPGSQGQGQGVPGFLLSDDRTGPPNAPVRMKTVRACVVLCCAKGSSDVRGIRSFIYFSCMCVCVYSCTQGHKMQTGVHVEFRCPWVSSSVTLCLTVLTHGLSLILELTSWTRLAGQPLRILLSPPLATTVRKGN